MPAVFINCGFAGSGKTTFTQALSQKIKQTGGTVYICNLDPAVFFLPYEPDLDIRDTINYHGVMEEYNLGPNGSILTCFNLFVTKIDEIIQILKTKKQDYIIIDTPGQVEVLTSSISGEILCKALLDNFSKVKLNYIIDLPSCYNKDNSINTALTTSNTLHACSVYLKMNVPLQIIYNKIDMISGNHHKQMENVISSDSPIEHKDMYEDFLSDVSEQFKDLSTALPHYFVSSTNLLNLDKIYI